MKFSCKGGLCGIHTLPQLQNPGPNLEAKRQAQAHVITEAGVMVRGASRPRLRAVPPNGRSKHATSADLMPHHHAYVPTLRQPASRTRSPRVTLELVAKNAVAVNPTATIQPSVENLDRRTSRSHQVTCTRPSKSSWLQPGCNRYCWRQGCNA